jgi:hypothetical protein
MMNPAFLRLAIVGNRHAMGRLMAAAFGIALGTSMIMLLMGAFSALSDREERSAWVRPVGVVADADAVADGRTAVLAEVQDWFEGRSISRIDVFAPAASASTLAAIPEWPRPGQYYASPALAALVDSVPPDMLGDRYGQRVGIIAPEHLKGPNALVVVTGQSLDDMRVRRGLLVAASAKGQPDTESTGFQAVAAIGAIGILFPVLLFVTIAARLGAATRRETFATLRLIGATSKQNGLVAGLDMLLVSTAGAALGIGAARVVRPVVARFELAGTQFYPSDLDVGPVATLLLALMVVAASTLVSAISTWRAGIGPLGPTRAMAEPSVRWHRATLLPAGLCMIALCGPGGLGPSLSREAALVLFLSGFAITSFGVVWMGPWLTAIAGRVVARRTQTAAGVMVANRIAQAPVASFRSVSGLVVGVFMVTVFAVASSGVSSRFLVEDVPDRLPTGALLVLLAEHSRVPGTIPGSSLQVVGFEAPGTGNEFIFSGSDLAQLGVSTPLAAAAYYQVNLSTFTSASREGVLAPRQVSVDAGTLAPRVLIAVTRGAPRMLELARTYLQTGTTWTIAPLLRTEASLLGANRVLKELSFVAYNGALVTILIAGLSLVLSTLGSIMDRKRVFGLLRLAGMPASMLDRIVLLEATVPLAAVLALSVVSGSVSAYLIVHALSDTISIGMPDPRYFYFVGAGLLGVLALLLMSKRAAYRLLDRQTLRFD